MLNYVNISKNFLKKSNILYRLTCVSLRRGDDCRVSLKRENKTAQTLSIVVGGFIACWLFFFIVYLITPFLPENTIPSTMMKWLTWLGECQLRIITIWVGDKKVSSLSRLFYKHTIVLNVYK